MAIEIWVATFGTTQTTTAAATINGVATNTSSTSSHPLIYRFSAATGAPVGTGAQTSTSSAQMILGAPIAVKHAGVLVARGTTVGCWAPDGQILRSLDGSGVATEYNVSSVSGNTVTAGGGDLVTSFKRPPRKALYVSTGASAEELWIWDGQTGVVQRYLASTGARITTIGTYQFNASDTTHASGFRTGDYILCGGYDIACVTTA